MRILLLFSFFIIIDSLFAQDGLTLLSRLELNFEDSIAGQSRITDVWGYEHPVSGKDYALVGNEGVAIVDAGNPFNPIVIAHVPKVSFFDIKTWKNYIYTVNGSSNGNGHVIDISDINNPIVVGTFPSAHNIFIKSDGLMYASNGKIYDLNSDPTFPQLIIDDEQLKGHDAFFKGDKLYVFGANTRPTRIFDFSAPLSFQLITEIQDPQIQYHHSGWVTEDDKYLYICDEFAREQVADITVWDISNINDPEKIKEFVDPSAIAHNLFVKNKYAYVSYYTAGLRIFDLENPQEPILTAQFDTGPDEGENFGGAFGVYPYTNSGIIFVSDRTTGLAIFSFDSEENKTNKQQIEWIAYPNPNGGIFEIIANNVHNKETYVIGMNPLGQQVYQSKPIITGGLLYAPVSIKDLGVGTYIFYVVNEQDRIAKKVFITEN